MRRLTGVRQKPDENGVLRHPRAALVLQAAGTLGLSDQVDAQRLRFWGHSLRRAESFKFATFAITGKHGFSTNFCLREQVRGLMEEAGLTVDGAGDRARWREGVAALNTARMERLAASLPT